MVGLLPDRPFLFIRFYAEIMALLDNRGYVPCCGQNAVF